MILSKKAINFNLPEAAALLSIYLRIYYIQPIQEKYSDLTSFSVDVSLQNFQVSFRALKEDDVD